MRLVGDRAVARSIVFLDRGIDDAAGLAAGTRPGIALAWLEPGRAALDQIADRLAGITRDLDRPHRRGGQFHLSALRNMARSILDRAHDSTKKINAMVSADAVIHAPDARRK